MQFNRNSLNHRLSVYFLYCTMYGECFILLCIKYSEKQKFVKMRDDIKANSFTSYLLGHLFSEMGLLTPPTIPISCLLEYVNHDMSKKSSSYSRVFWFSLYTMDVYG